MSTEETTPDSGTEEPLAEKLSTEHEEVTRGIAELRDQQSALSGVLKEVGDLKKTAEADRDATKAALDEISGVRDRFSNLNAETKSLKTEYSQLLRNSST